MARVVVEWHGELAVEAADAAIARGVSRGLDMIAETSQDRVLVDTGELKNSQNQSQDGNSGTVYYTDSKAVGAHENLTVTPRRGKRAKFLESALNDRRDDVGRAIGEELRKAL
jgi:hypothetical protein